MTRADAILTALKAAIEENRFLLDGEQHIRSVKIEIKISQDRRVRATVFNPEIESAARPVRVSDYQFQS